MLYYNITGWSFVFITQVVPTPITFSHCWRRDDQLVDTWRHARIELGLRDWRLYSFWQNRYNPEEMYTKRTEEKQK